MSRVSKGQGEGGDKPGRAGARLSLTLSLACLRAGGLAGPEGPHLRCHQCLWHAGKAPALPPLPVPCQLPSRFSLEVASYSLFSPPPVLPPRDLPPTTAPLQPLAHRPCCAACGLRQP